MDERVAHGPVLVHSLGVFTDQVGDRGVAVTLHGQQIRERGLDHRRFPGTGRAVHQGGNSSIPQFPQRDDVRHPGQQPGVVWGPVRTRHRAGDRRRGRGGCRGCRGQSGGRCRGGPVRTGCPGGAGSPWGCGGDRGCGDGVSGCGRAVGQRRGGCGERVTLVGQRFQRIADRTRRTAAEFRRYRARGQRRAVVVGQHPRDHGAQFAVAQPGCRARGRGGRASGCRCWCGCGRRGHRGSVLSLIGAGHAAA
ncbi:hypothetical protein SAMN05421835_14217 [Amycolatopsis sacchari]|uniref:Uncharacterized protein n=1 Tax=Amycolatopsis sacchari TaxID=115433 RepID=A0A1I4DBD4_9PSEU|nr:hypothetical protein SAMN05421835_14217 [Amycolatopsis sacchari]